MEEKKGLIDRILKSARDDDRGPAGKVQRKKITLQDLRRVIEDYVERADFFRVDVSEEEDMMWAYEVASTPTFIAFRDTEPVGALYGEVDRTEIANLLEDAIAGG